MAYQPISGIMFNYHCDVARAEGRIRELSMEEAEGVAEFARELLAQFDGDVEAMQAWMDSLFEKRGGGVS